jgi:small subunit ribosomal protein S16
VVKLRLKRFGRRNRAHFRLNAIDIRSPRDGRAIEELGYYDPVEKDQAKALQLNTERIKYWLSVGAQPSATAMSLLRRVGFDIKIKRQKRTTPGKPRAPKAAKAPAPGAPAPAAAAPAEPAAPATPAA